MGRFFEKFKIKSNIITNINNDIFDFIEEYNLEYEKLFSPDIFISKKNVFDFNEIFDGKINRLINYENDHLLKNLCKNFKYDYEKVKSLIIKHKMIDEDVKKHNIEYVDSKLLMHKDYFDNILKLDNPKVLLDREQREVIVNEENNCLVVAGAGAGKTTTIVAKVKYLVDIKRVDPQKILVISFTNKAVSELKERINHNLKINCKISTFHSCGYSLVSNLTGKKHRIITDGGLYNIVKEYIKKNIYNDKSALKNLILFFGYYMDLPNTDLSIEELIEQKRFSDLSTLKSNLNEINKEIIDSRKKSKRTIKNEIVQSYEEVQIANFLYLHNVEYEYEPAYPYYIPEYNKVYTPDFAIFKDGEIIYLEHFGITEDGYNNKYSDLELMKYKGNMASKILIHQKHNTKLLTTYSSYNDGLPLLEHLKILLEEENIPLIKRSEEDVYNNLSKVDDNKYFDRLIRLISSFIQNFKTKDFKLDDFSRLKNSTDNIRTKVFLEICEKAYLEYQRILKETNRVDFEDMINESSDLLRQAKNAGSNINLDYVIVDEYQDISRQRFNLTKELADLTKARIIAVGDDWQSIYAFAGSEIELFTKFKKEMGHADILYITHTYRNSQELIDIAGNFIQENPSQIRKKLISPKTISKPIVIFTYSDDPVNNAIKGIKGINEEKAKQLENVIEKILRVSNKPTTSILIIGRYGFDGQSMGNTSYFRYEKENKKFFSHKFPNANLTFLTAHSSKGLTFDNVIIINASNETYGFPSKIERDPVFKQVIHDDKSFSYAEERRLFYVALTRTSNRVFILTPENKPSEFILELMKYDNVVLHGKLNQDAPTITTKNKDCPICGYPLKLIDNKTYGLKLYTCTNEPEICDFMTNDLHGGKNSIKLCPECEGGILIVRKKINDKKYFLGCSNFYSKNICKYSEALKYDD